MTSTYTLMRALCESKHRRDAKRSKWRGPSETQLDLEKSLTRAIKTFISSAELTRSGVTMPDEQAHDQLLDTITRCLEQAVHEGKRVATGRQERGIINAAKNIAGRAVQLIGDIVDSLRAKAQDIIDALLGSDESVVSIDAAEQMLEEWAGSYAEEVAENEIQTAVQEASYDAYQDDGIIKLDVIPDPDACEVCIGIIEENSPVAIDQADKLPPYHFRCRCGTIEHEE